MRKVTHERKRNAWADRDELLHWCRGPRRNHVCRFLLRSLTGFERGGGQILGFSIDLLRRPYNTLALPCECVITYRHAPMHAKVIIIIIKTNINRVSLSKLQEHL